MKHLRRIGLVLVFGLTISSALSAQDPSVLLEKAIYTEETLGNLNEAIGIYQQIAAAAETNRATAALALYRLGMCYQKGGRMEDAQAAFTKLSKSYPEQKELISKIPRSASKGLEFRPAPWINGEVLRMAIKVRSGSQAGTQFYSVESVQESGKTAWRLRSVDGNISVSQFISLTMDAETLAPTSSIQKTGSYGEFRAIYTPKQVEFVTTRRGSVAKKQFPLDRAVYDYAQLAHLLRCLPLKEGFQAEVLVANPEKASVWDANITVVDRERVTVPAGIFDCYKTTVTMVNQEITFWISTDAHSYVVKEDHQGTLTKELISASIVEKGKPIHYEDSKSGISLDAPFGWLIGSNSLGRENYISFIGPEAESDGSLLFIDQKPEEMAKTSLDEDVDKDIAREQRQYKEFAVRPESRVTTTVSGFNAIRFIVDFKQLMSEKDTIRYHFYFMSPSRWYEIRFETDKEYFERLRPAFDSIISSLRVQ
jgi:hypothetical protein